MVSGDSASLISRSAAEVIASVPAAEPLAFLEEVEVAKVGATAAEEALSGGQDGAGNASADAAADPSSALVVAVLKAGRVTCWCGSKSARLPREQES